MGKISFSRYSRLILRHNIDVVKREIVLSGQVNAKMLLKLDKQLKLLENQDEPIHIVINTEGGHLYETMGIVDRIRNSPNEIITIGTCKIMSAGVIIIAAGDIRKATKYTRFMHHSAGMGMSYERMPNLEGEIKHTKELDRIMLQFLAERTSKPYSFWAITGKHVDYHFDAEQALEYGLIDEIL